MAPFLSESMVQSRCKNAIPGMHIALAAAILIFAIAGCRRAAPSEAGSASAPQEVSGHYAKVRRGDWQSSVRVSGTVGAVQSHSVVAPRLSGQMSGNMVATRIVRSGTRARAGDVLIEFDRQNQLKNILDRQAEYDNLVQQIRKKEADQAAARSADETELKSAEVDVQTARVEMRKNEVLPQYQADINKVNLAEAEARWKQLKDTLPVKREAQAAEVRILEIQRDRARLSVDYAQSNIEKMSVRSPLDGLVVLSQIRKGTRRVDPQEGDEFRPGSGIMVVVDTAHMQVTATVNQVDIAKVYKGQPAEIRLDAYPEMVFPGKVEQISIIGSPGEYSKRIRNFSILVSIQGSHPKLLPDLTASVDLRLDSARNVLLLPREAVIRREGRTLAELVENGKPRLQPIQIGRLNDIEVIVESGLREGAVVSLRPQVR